MEFQLESAVAVLARTPATLTGLLEGLDRDWTHANEGAETWSPYDVLGHLIHGEKTDWIPRARHILQHGSARAFEPFDRFAQLRAPRDRTIAALLAEFAMLRRSNLDALRGLDLTPATLALEGRHPEFGVVSMRELLATWVVHDLGHVAQIARAMAKQYSSEVGPWRAYLPVLGDRRG